MFSSEEVSFLPSKQDQSEVLGLTSQLREIQDLFVKEVSCCVNEIADVNESVCKVGKIYRRTSVQDSNI